MHSTGSFLYTVIERIRAMLDEPSMDAKFSNDFIVRHVISPSMVDVLTRISMTYDNPVILRHSVSLVANEQYYQLPPSIGEVLRFAITDSNGRVINESLPTSMYNRNGSGWSLEGNLLSISPTPSGPSTADIFYSPNGDFFPHFADGTTSDGTKDGVLSGDRDMLVLAQSPTLGSLETRENGYAGGVLRLWNHNENILEERIISSYNVSGRTVTVRVPFTSDIETSNGHKYEIAPQGIQSLYQAIALAGAMNMAASRNVSDKQMKFYILQYRAAIKTIGDNLSYMQMRIPKHYEKNTVDNDARFLRTGWVLD